MKVYMKRVSIKLWDILGCFHYILNAPHIKLGYNYTTIGLIFGLILHLNPYVLCAINMGSVDESLIFGNKLVSNAHVMV